MNRDGRIAFLAIFVLAATICFTGLLCPLQEPQESRYAEIPRQMLAEGSVVVPLLHGQPYYDKPPLLYWLVMASYSLLGVNESAARLIPCVAAFLTILIAYGWAYRLAGWRAAFLGSAMLCLSPRFVQLDRMLTPDCLLTLFVVAAWASGHLALAGNRLHRGWWLASAIACGLGLLTKGPVAPVLVVPMLMAIRWLDRESARPGWRAMGCYLAVSVGLAAPWFVAVAMRDESFLAYFFWFHHVQRYMEPFDHAEPFWFYLPEILFGMLPWTLLLPGLLLAVFRRPHAVSGPAGNNPREGEAPAEPYTAQQSATSLADSSDGTRGGWWRGHLRLGRSLALPWIEFDEPYKPLRYFLVAALWCVGFFSLAGCKRGFYVLPAVPPLALALGCHLDRLLGDASQWSSLWRQRSRLAFLTLLLVIGGAVAGSIACVVCGIIQESFAFAMLWLIALIGALVGIGGWRGGLASWCDAGTAMSLLMLTAVLVFLPGYAEKFSLRDELHSKAACGLAHAPLFCYPKAWDSVNFYLGREDVRAFRTNELDGLVSELARTPGAVVLVRTGLAGAVRDKLPASVRWEPMGRPGHLTMGRVALTTTD